MTSASAERAQEGTTFEVSCYTDPLGIEHLTGSLSAAIRHFGAWDAPVQLRFTTKFAAVEPLLDLPHNRRTRIRFSVNPRAAAHYEGGTDPLDARLAAMAAAARAGYPVGLTVAPILPVPDWGGRLCRTDPRRRRRAGRRARSGSHRRTHHPPVHAGLEGGAARLVSRLGPAPSTRRSASRSARSSAR